MKPRLVTRIEAPDGTLLWSTEIQRRRRRWIAQDAYEITQMLQGVVNYGTGKAVRDMGVTGPVAGKTGTTNNGERRLVRRLHADARRGHLVRLRHAAADQHATRPAAVSPRRRGRSSTRPAGTSRAARRSRRRREWCRRSSIRESGELATEWCPTRDAAVVQAGQRAARKSVICTPGRRRDRSRDRRGGSRRRANDPIGAWGGASATFCGRSFTGRAARG